MKLKPKKRRLNGLSAAEREESYQLYDHMMSDKITMRELVRLSFLRGLTTAENYAWFLEIEKEYPEDVE
jgi:hypothetical protein